MPEATVTTTEEFAANTPESVRDKAVALRIKAGAIRSSFSGGGGDELWILTTEWNVFGQQ